MNDAIRLAKSVKPVARVRLSEGGELELRRAKMAKERAGGQDLPSSKFMPNVPRQVRSDGGDVTPDIQNPMSVFPKPQRMFPEDDRPAGGQYLSMPDKQDMTGHKSAAASIGIGSGGKPYFTASRDAVDETGTSGKGNAVAKTNLFKQKAGWRWKDAPEGHENTNTIVSVEHRGKHYYALNAHFPKGVDLARYENAPSEPRLRPTTRGNIDLGPQVGSILVKRKEQKEHPVYQHVIVKADGGEVLGLAKSIKPVERVRLASGGTPPVTIGSILQRGQPMQQPITQPTPTAHPLEATMNMENKPSVVISPLPGVRGRLSSENQYLDPNIKPDDALTKWSPSTPNLIGAPVPPPVQAPVHSAPRHEELVKHVSKIFKDKNFQDFVEKNTGLSGVKVTSVNGMFENNREPTFIVHHPNMTDDHTNFLAPALGFGFQQDAAVRLRHNPDVTEGIPSMLIGTGNKLSQKQISSIMDAAKEEGLEGAQETRDNKAVKFLHFEGEDKLPDFFDKIDRVMQRTKMPQKLLFHSESELINNEDYFKRLYGKDGSREGDPDSPSQPSDIFRGIVSNVLAPYAKAISGEGYRLSPERLAQTHDLTPQETIAVRDSLYPSGRKVNDRTTIPLMTDEENLDVRPTGANGKNTVDDALFALQNRAAKKGQIELGDYSDKARDLIAHDMAKEVAFHVNNSDKSAIGWYDAALKKALSQYHEIFPELKTDKNKEMLFHALLGITSQGNNVYENSVYAARMYNLIRDGATIPEALEKLRGGFGGQTRAIEGNIEKLHHLLETNKYDRMRGIFNKKMTVSAWKSLLRSDKTLYGPNGQPLDSMIKGAKNQKVTGWSVFGPKIGSFINNLHGDYSTLTADLWFSRSWNRLLGHNFVHTPIGESKQYTDFRDALKAEYEHHNGFPSTQTPFKTSQGKYTDKQWEHGTDTKGMSPEDFKELYNDPDELMNYAYNLEASYKKGGYKDKSDLKRRAKNWVENRENAVAAPRSGLERDFQQRTAEKAQEILRKKHNLNIDIADIQAALWFHEKELFGKLGVASEKAKPADYEDAAKHTLGLSRKGDLYTVKSKNLKKLAPPPPPPPPEESEEGPEHDAFGGSVRGAYKSGGGAEGSVWHAYKEGGEVEPTLHEKLAKHQENYIPHDDPRRGESLAEFHKDAHPDLKNPDGSPKVFYHGTRGQYRKPLSPMSDAYLDETDSNDVYGPTRDFETFDTKSSEMGSHFGSKEQAGDFTGSEPEQRGHMYPVHLNIKNPIRLQDNGSFSARRVKAQLPEGMVGETSGYSVPQEVVQKALKEHGYDGIVYLNRREGLNDYGKRPSPEDLSHLGDDAFKKVYPEAQDSYIAFDPEQIKSASGNQGTFDPTKPKMNEARGGFIHPVRAISGFHIDTGKVGQPMFTGRL